MSIRMLTLVCALSLAGIADAASDATVASDADLRARVERLESTVREQNAVLAAYAEKLREYESRLATQDERLVRQNEENGAARAERQDDPRVAFEASRPVLSSADGRSTVSLRGRFFADMAHYDQRAAGPLATDFRRGSVGGAGNREALSAQDLSSGLNFRRAQIGVDGRFGRDWTYRLLYEFGGTGTEGPARINDVYLGYAGIPGVTLQIGAFAPPSNLDDASSIDDALFLERATPAEISRALAGGEGRYSAGARASGQRWTAALHVTGGVVNDAETFDEQRGAVARVTALAFVNANSELHLGMNGSWVFSTQDTLGLNQTGTRAAIRLRDRPELRVDSTRLIDTGAIDAASASAWGLEAGWRWKSLLARAERFEYGVQRRSGVAGGDPRFDAWYGELSWIATGETRRYQSATGSWAGPRPVRAFARDVDGFGALEFAARYSFADLDWNAGNAGALTPAGGIRGGEQRILTFGLNWYPNSLAKVMLDWSHVEIDRLNPAGIGNLTPYGASPLTPPAGVQIGQDLDIVSASVRFSF